MSLALRSPAPILILWGADGIALYNDACATLVGDRHPALLGAAVREGWPELAPLAQSILEAGLSGGSRHYRDQKLSVRRDGRTEQVWLDLACSPILDEAGVPAGVLCLLAESGARAAAEQRSAFLLSLSDDLRPLATPSAIMETTARRLGGQLAADRVFYAEIVGARMTVEADFSTAVPSMRGEHSLEAFGPDLLGAYRIGSPIVVHDTATDARFCEAARAGLAERQVGAFIDVVLFEEEKWVGLLAVQSAAPRAWTPEEERLVQEVGERAKTALERARAEARLRDLNETLEQRVAEEVAERTKAEEALIQARKMEAIGQLTGGVAHDFNNLLGAVVGNLDLLSRKLSDERLRRFVDGAMAGAKRGAQLTRQLLAFARRQKLEPRAVDVNGLIGSAVDNLLRRALGGMIAIELLPGDQLWSATVDPVQLESALLNLVVNARDAMPDGGTVAIETSNVRIVEGTHSELPPGDYVLLAVTDTGTGMPAEVAERATEPFFTTKGVGKGTGLGLSTVYGFLRQSGGTIRITSHPGQGTTVQLYLPRSDHEAREDAEPPAQVEAPSGGEIVLLVDDDDDVRATTADLLAELGWAVVSAATGARALEILAENPRLRLVVTDYAMPAMNGAEFLKRARAIRPELKALVATGYAQDAELDSSLAGSVVLRKPFSLADLANGLGSLTR